MIPAGLNRPGVPCSRLQSIRAFPEGLEGLAAGIEDIGTYKERPFMPLYEHVYLARQDLSTQQVEELTAKFAGVVAEAGGKVTKTEYWGLKSLTYRIHKNRKAHLTLLNVDAAPAALNEIERQERLHEDVLRYLTIRVEELEEGPSAMMRKSDRDDRGERGDRGGRFDRGDRDRGERRPRREEGAGGGDAQAGQAGGE